MNDLDRPSPRVVEQRLRNRAMEALETFAAGNDGLRRVGVVEYVEEFCDVINDEVQWHWQEWTCFAPEEVQALDEVQKLLKAACGATPQDCSDDIFISSGWPARIQPVAAAALVGMQARGRFREDIEEEQPSLPD